LTGVASYYRPFEKSKAEFPAGAVLASVECSVY
jgi:hypothetical protein